MPNRIASIQKDYTAAEKYYLLVYIPLKTNNHRSLQDNEPLLQCYASTPSQ